MNEESKSINPIDYILSLYLNNGKKDKIEKKILNLKDQQINDFQYNKRKELILFKDSIGPSINSAKLAASFLLLSGIALSGYIHFRYNKLNRLLKISLIGFNLWYYYSSYFVYNRFKDIRSICLDIPSNRLIVKTNDKLIFKMKVEDVINLSSEKEPMYTFYSEEYKSKTNKYYFFIIQNPQIKTLYKSSVFNEVLIDHFELNLT